VTGALIITRGLPASGKSTWARAWVGRSRRRARVNRDDLRMTMFGRYVLSGWQEELVTTAEEACVEALLREGVDVVVDDTNLRRRHARAWADLASRLGAPFDVRSFTDVPLEVCLARDAARTAAGERGTGEQVIRDLYSRFLSSGPLPPVPSPPGSGAPPPVPSALPPSVPDGLPVPATVPTARGGYLPDPRCLRRGSSTSTARWRS
jgi:predicted kinase